VLHFAPISMDSGQLGRGMVILQLCHCKFHTKKLCSRHYSTEIEFY